MHFDYNKAVFPVEESSTVVIKICLVFQRTVYSFSVSFSRKAKQTPKTNKQTNNKNPANSFFKKTVSLCSV